MKTLYLTTYLSVILFSNLVAQDTWKRIQIGPEFDQNGGPQHWARFLIDDNQNVYFGHAYNAWNTSMVKIDSNGNQLVSKMGFMANYHGGIHDIMFDHNHRILAQVGESKIYVLDTNLNQEFTVTADFVTPMDGLNFGTLSHYRQDDYDLYYVGDTSVTIRYTGFTIAKRDSAGNDTWWRVITPNVDTTYYHPPSGWTEEKTSSLRSVGIDVTDDGNGGIIGLGTIYLDYLNPSHSAYLFWFRVDSNGNLVADRVWGNPSVGLAYWDKHLGEIVRNNNEIISATIVEGTNSDRHILLTSMDTSLNVNWSKSYDVTEDVLNGIESIEILKNGDILLNVHAGIQQNELLFSVKTNANGDVIWCKTRQSYTAGVKEFGEGFLTIVSKPDSVHSTTGIGHFQIAKLDTNLNHCDWLSSDLPITTSIETVGDTAIQIFCPVGTSSHFDNPYSWPEAPQHSFNTLIYSDSIACGLVTSVPNFENIELLVYPNPSSSVLNFELLSSLTTHIKVNGINGRLLYEGQHSGSFFIDVSRWSPGFYTYKLIDPKSGAVKMDKFVVE